MNSFSFPSLRKNACIASSFNNYYFTRLHLILSMFWPDQVTVNFTISLLPCYLSLLTHFTLLLFLWYILVYRCVHLGVHSCELLNWFSYVRAAFYIVHESDIPASKVRADAVGHSQVVSIVVILLWASGSNMANTVSSTEVPPSHNRPDAFTTFGKLVDDVRAGLRPPNPEDSQTPPAPNVRGGLSDFSSPPIPDGGWSSPDFSLGAGMVIIQPSTHKIVVLHSVQDDEWFFPKGRKDIGESLEKAALREAFEEVFRFE
jgi:hypothetical protein